MLQTTISLSHKPVIGLTGGIACGKSTVAKILEDLGWAILDTDQITKDLLEPKEIGWFKVRHAFGTKYFSYDEKLERTKFSRDAFNTPGMLKKLEEILVPCVTHELEARIQQLQKTSVKGIVIESATLIELGLEDCFENLWVVTTDSKTQLARLMCRNNLTSQEAQSKISSQLPLEVKASHAEVLIDTTIPTYPIQVEAEAAVLCNQTLDLEDLYKTWLEASQSLKSALEKVTTKEVEIPNTIKVGGFPWPFL